MKVPRDSWDIIQKIIRRYPEQKEEYEELEQEIREGTYHADGQPGGGMPGNPTERIALQLHTPRMERIRKEIYAVEKVYTLLPEEHKKVIRVRFWSARYKNMPYLWMERCVSYKEAQIRRICGKFIKEVGIALGEVGK